MGEDPYSKIRRNAPGLVFLPGKAVVAKLLEVLCARLLNNCLAFVAPQVLNLNRVHCFLVVPGLDLQVWHHTHSKLFNSLLSVDL